MVVPSMSTQAGHTGSLALDQMGRKDGTWTRTETRPQVNSPTSMLARPTLNCDLHKIQQASWQEEC